MPGETSMHYSDDAVIKSGMIPRTELLRDPVDQLELLHVYDKYLWERREPSLSVDQHRESLISMG